MSKTLEQLNREALEKLDLSDPQLAADIRFTTDSPGWKQFAADIDAMIDEVMQDHRFFYQPGCECERCKRGLTLNSE